MAIDAYSLANPSSQIDISGIDRDGFAKPTYMHTFRDSIKRKIEIIDEASHHVVVYK